LVPADHAKLRRQRILAALRRQTLDGMLVRVSSIDRDTPRAYRKQFDFTAALAESMPAAERARLFGSRA
jgi:hypothetical protein